MRHPWSIARRIAVVHVALVAAEAGGVVDVATDSGTVFTVEVPRDPRPQEET